MTVSSRLKELALSLVMNLFADIASGLRITIYRTTVMRVFVR